MSAETSDLSRLCSGDLPSLVGFEWWGRCDYHRSGSCLVSFATDTPICGIICGVNEARSDANAEDLDNT